MRRPPVGIAQIDGRCIRCHTRTAPLSGLRVAAIIVMLMVTIQVLKDTASNQKAMTPFHATGPVWVNTQKLPPKTPMADHKHRYATHRGISGSGR